MDPSPKYSRILLKLGGEALAGEQGFGIDPEQVRRLGEKIKSVLELDVQVAIVMGGGNFWRGLDGIAHGMERATADQIGMLATVMNAIALQDALEQIHIDSRVQTAIEMKAVAEPYIRRRAIRHLEKGRVVILGAGTGNPYFTTDSAGALRAMEVDATVLIKATKVDGVYDADPLENPQAIRFDSLSYIEALNRRVRVIDSTAISLCMENNLPILVLNLWAENSLTQAVTGARIGTLISE